MVVNYIILLYGKLTDYLDIFIWKMEWRLNQVRLSEMNSGNAIRHLIQAWSQSLSPNFKPIQIAAGENIMQVNFARKMQKRAF